MSALVNLPAELLILIVRHLAHGLTSSKSSLAALNSTCKYLHRITLPILFSSYTRCANGDSVGLIKFVRSLLTNPGLSGSIHSLSIDDNQNLHTTYPSYLPSRRRGWKLIPSQRERSVDIDTGTGRFKLKPNDAAWGSFLTLTAEDWESGRLMDGKEWQSVEKKVKAICSSRAWLMGSAAVAEDAEREWGAVEVGRAQAAWDLGCPWVRSDVAAGMVQDERVEKFRLKNVDRSAEGWLDGWECREYDGWRLDEPLQYSTPSISKLRSSPRLAERDVENRWLRTLRLGSRDAWSALLLVLCTGTTKLENTICNWYARPDPMLVGEGEHLGVGSKAMKEVEERCRWEDEDWAVLGGLTWVGRVMRQCAIQQAYSMAIEENKRQEEAEPAAKRNMIEVKREAHEEEETIQILPRLREVVIGSTPHKTEHPNLSLNTLLHFLQPPRLAAATIIGLTDLTFGTHERKPSGMSSFSSSIRKSTFNNCNATADALGYLVSFMPKLEYLCIRAPLRKVYNPNAHDFPCLTPGKFVPNLAEYCPRLQRLDLGPSNRCQQHGTDEWDNDLCVSSFSQLHNLEVLWCRVEHFVGHWICSGDGQMIGALGKERDNMKPWHEEAAKPINDELVVLKYMLPEGLRELVVGVDSRAWKSFLEPLRVWIEGMDRGRAKLRWIELRCGNEEVRKQIRVTKAFGGVVQACMARGIHGNLRVVE